MMTSRCLVIPVALAVVMATLVCLGGGASAAQVGGVTLDDEDMTGETIYQPLIN